MPYIPHGQLYFHEWDGPAVFLPGKILKSVRHAKDKEQARSAPGPGCVRAPFRSESPQDLRDSENLQFLKV
jgi:hypothetical protein